MGKAFSILRGTQYAYVQKRAERIISQAKPAMHPFHPTEEKIMNRMRLEHPELNEKVVERRRHLEENVNKLRIVSRAFQENSENGGNEETQDKDENRDLPRDRLANKETQYEYYRPSETIAPPGKILFGDFMELLKEVNRRDDIEEPKLTFPELAEEFKIDEEKLKSIAKYFVPFNRSLGYDFIPEHEQLMKLPNERKQELLNRAEIVPELKARMKALSRYELQQMNKMIQEFNEKKAQENSEKKVIEGKNT